MTQAAQNRKGKKNCGLEILFNFKDFLYPESEVPKSVQAQKAVRRGTSNPEISIKFFP